MAFPSFCFELPMEQSIFGNSSMQQDNSCNCRSARLLQQLLQLKPELAQLLQQLQQAPFQLTDPGSFPGLPQTRETPNEQLQQQPLQSFHTPGSFPAVADGLRQQQPTTLLLLQPSTSSHVEQIVTAETNNVMKPNVSINFVGTTRFKTG